MESRITLRHLPGLFLSFYLFFYIFPFPFDDMMELPVLEKIGYVLEKGPELLTEWIGGSLLGLDDYEKVEQTGSGDTLYDYVAILSCALLALIMALIIYFSRLSRRRYHILQHAILVYARYFLGLTLIAYGYVKLVEGQFLIPGSVQLEKAYGDSSPMNLLWTFMGYSRPYTFFTGMAECLAGVFLLFRRSTYLGCLLGIGVMMNVVMLNFSYDVPVKLFSSHLLIFQLIILFPAIRSIATFFLGNERVALPAAPTISFSDLRWQGAGRIAKLIVLAGLIILTIVEFNSYNIPKPGPFAGTYQPEIFVLNQDTMVTPQPDSVQWKKLYLDRFYGKLETMDGNYTYYRYDIDSANQQLNLYGFRDSTEQYTFEYEQLPEGMLILQGIYQEDTLYTRLQVRKVTDYLLMNRGFHWISQYPFNR